MTYLHNNSGFSECASSLARSHSVDLSSSASFYLNFRWWLMKTFFPSRLRCVRWMMKIKRITRHTFPYAANNNFNLVHMHIAAIIIYYYCYCYYAHTSATMNGGFNSKLTGTNNFRLVYDKWVLVQRFCDVYNLFDAFERNI